MHLINGLYDCQRNNVPVLAIAAHIPSCENPAMDILIRCLSDISLRNAAITAQLVSEPDQMPRIL